MTREERGRLRRRLEEELRAREERREERAQGTKEAICGAGKERPSGRRRVGGAGSGEQGAHARRETTMEAEGWAQGLHVGRITCAPSRSGSGSGSGRE